MSKTNLGNASTLSISYANASLIYNSVLKRDTTPIMILDIRSFADYVEKHIHGAVYMDNTKLASKEFRDTLTSRFKAFNYIFNGNSNIVSTTSTVTKFVICDYSSASFSNFRKYISANYSWYAPLHQIPDTTFVLIKGGFEKFQEKYPFMIEGINPSTAPKRFFETCFPLDKRIVSPYPTELIPDFLYLGSIESTSPHVLTLCREKVQRVSGTKYLQLGVLDVPSTEISKMFAASFHFIEKAKMAKGKVLVHCVMGVSRSATIAIAYLMKTYKLPLDCALTLVKKKRHVEPNEGFMRQLTEFEIEHDLHTIDDITKYNRFEKISRILE